MGSRFFRVFLVCFLVCMLVCSPALAASTTESQIMMMSDDDSDSDAGVMPLAFYDDDFTVQLSAYLYDSYTFEYVTPVSSSNSSSVSYSPGIKLSADSVYNASDILHPDDTYFVLNVLLVANPNDGFAKLAYSGDQLSMRFVGLAVQPYAGSTYFHTLIFDHATIGYWGITGSSVNDDPDRDVNSISESFLVPDSSTWRSFLLSNLFVPYDSSIIPVRFYFKCTNWDSLFQAAEDNGGTFAFGGWFGNNRYPNTAIYISGASAGSGTSSSSDNAIKETTNAVNQVNQSIQQTISAVHQVSADLAALSNAVQQMTQQFLSGLEQQTNAISSLVTAQIQQIRQDLGLVNDNLSSGFSSVTNSITNQTQQVTQKIDTLQQNVVNKLDTVNQSITDLSDVTQKGFEDVNKGITDLPGKIGEMLKSLIVPDSEQLADKYSDFTDLAEEKLGVIYQVPEMVFEMGHTVVDGVTNQETQMQLPAFKLVMPDGEYTLWEEQKFDIWPAGTEVIQDAVKLATSMLCVILTFNSLKRKYEEWLDGR